MPVRTGDDTRAALHAVELAALQTATETSAAYRRITQSPWFRADIAAPLRDGVPEAPLVAAIADLACAAHAAARALHFSAEDGGLAVAAAGRCADAAAVEARVRLAHAVALAAHSAATALEVEGRGATAVPFPQSSRRLIRLLSASIDEEAGRRRAVAGDPPPAASAMHLDAACAARDAAAHAMRAHERCRVDGATTRVMCRVARLASRASAHAGFAALRDPR